MKPPICCICLKPLDPAKPGNLVAFAKSESDHEYDRKAQTGFTGHPPYADWFCHRHIAAAQKRTHLSLTQAIEQIKRA